MGQNKIAYVIDVRISGDSKNSEKLKKEFEDVVNKISLERDGMTLTVDTIGVPKESTTSDEEKIFKEDSFTVSGIRIQKQHPDLLAQNEIDYFELVRQKIKAKLQADEK